MVNRRKYSEEDAKGVARRIRACRVLTGMNQHEFAEKHLLPQPSIKSWEYGMAIPRSTGLDKIILACKKEGISVKKSWLLEARGAGPMFNLEGEKLLNNNIDNLDDCDDFFEFFKKKCKKRKKNPVLAEVVDDEMAPIFCKGDRILGILIDESTLTVEDVQYERRILVKSGNDGFVPRFIQVVEGAIFVSSNKDVRLKKISSGIFARICQHHIYSSEML